MDKIEVNKVYQGDVMDVLKTFPDGFVDTVITSPPYYQLRDYGYEGQWGVERTYQEYLDKMIDFMSEIKRVTKTTGTIWINIGDTYSTTRWANVQIAKTGEVKQYDSTYMVNRGESGLLVKQKDYPQGSLFLIPHRFAMRCIDELGLILRNGIIWAKRNGMPESVESRFSKKHEFMFFFVKSNKYYFDFDAIRERYVDIARAKRPYNFPKKYNGITHSHKKPYMCNYERGKNPGDVSDFWDIPVKPNKKQHYAVFNSDIISRPILAGCPEFVCKKCGKPRVKIFEEREIVRTKPSDYALKTQTGGKTTTFNGGRKGDVIGMTDCGCGEGFEPGLVLDPFCGTGTTLERAAQLGRRVIGIDAKEEYCNMARESLKIALSQGKLF